MDGFCLDIFLCFIAIYFKHIRSVLAGLFETKTRCGQWAAAASRCQQNLFAFGQYDVNEYDIEAPDNESTSGYTQKYYRWNRENIFVDQK